MGNKKKKYVRPLMEELGFESEVHMLTISQDTNTTLQKMSIDTTFDGGTSSTGARESGYDFVFDEE